MRIAALDCPRLPFKKIMPFATLLRLGTGIENKDALVKPWALINVLGKQRRMA
jgi:hypothetical protein